jgi:hypothetical protein
MFMLYMLDNETRDYEIFMRSKRRRVAVMYKNESVWWFPAP